MTDQELRRLSRADLIDIIYTLQQQKEQAEQQLAQAQAQLQERQAAEHWKRFQLQAGQLIQAHAELQAMFKGMANR